MPTTSAGSCRSCSRGPPAACCSPGPRCCGDLRAVRGTPRAIALLALVGLLDTGGYVAFNVGVRHADTGLVAAASAPYAVVPIVTGALLLGERPTWTQRAGAAAVIAGVALLGAVS